MNAKKEEYLKKLKTEKKLIQFLLSESHLPGPRANLELAFAFAEVADQRVAELLCEYDSDLAPADDPKEFLCFCGILAFGKLIVNGHPHYYNDLKRFAADTRWRIREAVGLALQIIGKKDPLLLMSEMLLWARGSLYEKRAVIGGLCHPDFLVDKISIEQTYGLLDKITRSLPGVKNKRVDEYKILRKALGYCWSIAIDSEPDIGVPLFEKLIEIADKDIIWIMRENLKNNRMKKIDQDWTDKLLAQLNEIEKSEEIPL
jgi:hypothetical protein